MDGQNNDTVEEKVPPRTSHGPPVPAGAYSCIVSYALLAPVSYKPSIQLREPLQANY